MKKFLNTINKPLKTMALLMTAGLISMMTASCKKDSNNNDEKQYGKLEISFEHYVDGNPLVLDSMMYQNAAGNRYLVYEVQYFVTEVTLYKHGGGERQIKDWQDYFYVDTNIPSTLKWAVYDELDPGSYDSLSFRLGFRNEKNESFMFVNPPESNMVWPEYLGGGYHYMKLNGKWLDTNNYVRGFAFHLGKGQNYDSQGNPIPPFIDNSVRVSLPSSAFSIEQGKTSRVIIRMNIENWFQDPHIYDHNQWGGDIMQKQAAMAMAVDNSRDVFQFVN